MSDSLAKDVLAGKSGHDDIVDVSVGEDAVRRGDAAVTSNATHIQTIAEAARARLRIESIQRAHGVSAVLSNPDGTPPVYQGFCK